MAVLTDISIPHAGHVLAVDDQGYVLCQYPVTRTVRTDSGTMPYTFHQYTLLGPDFTVLQDGIDQYYNVGQYDYSCDSELFYNGLVAVRVGATDWYLPDGGPWPRLYFNSKYMFIDRSGKNGEQQPLRMRYHTKMTAGLVSRYDRVSVGQQRK